MKNKTKSNDLSQIRRELKIVSDKASFGYNEAYKSLRTNVEYLLNKDQKSDTGKIIMITSSLPGEGKTNISINLATTLAQDNKQVILIDCDLRAGRIFRYLRVSPSIPDLTDVLNDKSSLDEATIYFNTLKLSVIISSDMSTNPSELLSSAKMKETLQELTDRYDYVILDTPPVNAVSDTLIVSRYVDGAIMVVSHNEVKQDVVLSAKEQLEKIGTPILGVVLNKYNAKNSLNHGKDYGYYNYSYKKYGYGYGYGENKIK